MKLPVTFRRQNPLEVTNVIRSSPEAWSDAQLVDKIESGIKSADGTGDNAIAERVGTALANDQGSEDLANIVKESLQGKIDTLVLGNGESVWGRVDRQSQAVVRQPQEEADSIDLVNFAVHGTLAASGTVVQDDNRGTPAAIYRY